MRYGRPRGSLFILALVVLIVLTGAYSSHGRASALPLAGIRNSGATFEVETPPPGMASRTAAIRTAIHFAFGQSATRPPAQVKTRAYFGLYTDTIYKGRPVWIVRFWGPGLQIEGSGGPVPLPGTPYCEPRAAHEELVIVDGKTGKYLEGTVGLIPIGLPTVVTTPEPVPTPCATRPLHAMTPWTIAVTSRGNLFLGGPGLAAYRQYSEVQKRSASGRLLFSFSTQASQGNEHQIIRLALDAHGDVYVANDDNLIQKFGPNGHLLWQWFPRGRRLPQTDGWWHIAVTSSGTAYAASPYRPPIYVLSSEGKVIGRRSGRWSSFAVGPDGTLYALSLQQDLVQSFSPTGKRLRRWHISSNKHLAFEPAITVARDGTVYVLNEQLRYYDVTRYTSAGRVLHRIRIPGGPGPGQLLTPRDLAVGPKGIVYLTDTGNPRVVIYSGAGRYLGSWTL